jgi:hypothetical protein
VDKGKECQYCRRGSKGWERGLGMGSEKSRKRKRGVIDRGET